MKTIEIGWDNFRNSGAIAPHRPDPEGEEAIREFLAKLEGFVDRQDRQRNGRKRVTLFEAVSRRRVSFCKKCLEYLRKKQQSAKHSGLPLSSSESKMIKALVAAIEQKAK